MKLDKSAVFEVCDLSVSGMGFNNILTLGPALTMPSSQALNSGGLTSPDGQSHSIKCSTTDVLSHAYALIYTTKSLVVVVVNYIQVKLLSRQVVVQSVVLHLLECLLGLSTVLMLSVRGN